MKITFINLAGHKTEYIISNNGQHNDLEIVSGISPENLSVDEQKLFTEELKKCGLISSTQTCKDANLFWKKEQSKIVFG